MQKIEQLDFFDHRFEFKGGEYVMSHVTQEELNVRLVRIESANGVVGWGEIVRKSSVDLKTAMESEKQVLDALPGKSLSEIPAICAEIRTRGKMLMGLAFGLETAYLDWLGRQSYQPLHALLGGQRSKRIPDYYSASCDTPEIMASKFQTESTGWPVVQVKLGVGGLDEDRKRLDVSLSSLSANQLSLMDFNGELDVESALSVIAEYSAPRIVWEEPCDNLVDNTEVARRSGKPVMFDQCLDNLEAFTRAVSDGLAHSLCIKPPFLGGLGPASTARDLCSAAGMRMRVDGPWCGHIASAAILHLAVTIPPELLVSGCDLRQSFDLEEDWGGTQHLDRHMISPLNQPGHGVLPPDSLNSVVCPNTPNH